jgi:hypothetical protein
MALIGGDPAELDRAAARLRPVVSDVEALAGAVRSAGYEAEASAGNQQVSAALTQLAGAVATATSGTTLILGHLGDVATLSASGFQEAGGVS